MQSLGRFAFLSVSLALAACVTINIYFPEAAAEKAADQIIDEVWGNPGGLPADQSSAVPASAARLLAGIFTWIVPSAHAQSANIDISTPTIDALTASMGVRHRQLAPFYTRGAAGQTQDGLVAVRDLAAAPVKDRKRLNELVAAENRDRDALYAEIARANGHPEWEQDIRSTFARRWIQRGAPGWWYQDPSGNWRQR